MPSVKDRLHEAVATLKASLTQEQIDLVINLITIFIEADRRGALVSDPHDEGGE